MPDLDERFRSLSRAPVPDLWEDARERTPRPLPRAPRGSRVVTVFVAFAVAAAGVGAATFALRGGSPAHRPASGSGEGRIAFVAPSDGTWQVFSVDPDGTDLEQLTHVSPPDVVDDVAWSPDGARLAYVVRPSDTDRSEIWVADADGSGGEPLGLEPGSREPSWSPDGTEIAYTTSAGRIWIVGADGTGAHAFTNCGPPECVADSSPAWSPDGSSIAFVRESGAGAVVPFAIFVWPVHGDVPAPTNTALDGATWARELAWSPDGARLAFTRSVADAAGFGMFVMQTDGSRPERLEGPPTAQSLTWSPDGERIAFMADAQGTDHETLYVMDAGGSTARPVPGLPADASWPSWAPVAEEPTHPPSRVDRVSVDLSVTPHVADFPTAVAVGEGGVWVTAQRQDGSGAGEVIRLDPATGEVVARIDVRAAPGWEFGGAGLTVGEGSVWVVGQVRYGDRCCHALVTRVDPSTNAVADEIEVPGESRDLGNDVWGDDGSLYVLMGVDGGSIALELAKLDLASHEVLWRIPVPGQWSQTVFTAAGSVWVLGTEPDAHGPIEVDMLYRFDPDDGSPIDQLPLDTSLYAPVVAGDMLWLRGADGAQRLDAMSGALVGEPVKPAPGCCTGAFVGDGEGGVWVISSPGAGAERAIWHLDAAGEVAASGTIETRATFEQMLGQSYAFDPATQTIWVQHYQDSVARIALRSG
jgi:Tol biopolymer transport system component